MDDAHGRVNLVQINTNNGAVFLKIKNTIPTSFFRTIVKILLNSAKP